MKHEIKFGSILPWFNLLVLWSLSLFLSFWLLGTSQAAAQVTLSTASLSKSGELKVAGQSSGSLVDLYDINGRRLWSGKGGAFSVTLPADQLASKPCQIRAESSGTEAIKAVAGAPTGCSSVPSCSIQSPVAGAVFKVNTGLSFKAIVKGKPASLPFTYEWDFAGGAMTRATGQATSFGTVQTKASFVRNDSTYRVRLVVIDALGRRCEDAVNIAVGKPPAGLPGKVSEQPRAKFGSELSGLRDDVVVMPYEEWSFQNLSDMRLVPNGYGSFPPIANSVRAYAFRKDRLPVFLDDSSVDLRYSAGSNPADPVGSDSINSTSRNWPVSARMAEAQLKKTDMWEIPTRPDAEKDKDYFACSWAMTGYWSAYGCNAAQGRPEPDEGYYKISADDKGNPVQDPNTRLDHGAYMPGKNNPYVANNPQPFSRFEITETARVAGGMDKPANWFEANLLPYTDVDDQGRVNPYSVIRVEAVDKATKKVVARTDGVVTSSRDFHCRECHAKGQVAANPKAPYTKAAFASSAWGQWAVSAAKNPALAADYVPRYLVEDNQKPEKPEFFEVSDFGGDPDNIHDQEYAAALNYSSLHQYYDVISFLNDMLYANDKFWLTDEEKHNPKNIKKDTPRPCYGCHATALAFEPFKNSWWDEDGFRVDNPVYAPNYSIAMHRWHGEMQWNKDKTDIVRDDRGAHIRWDWKTKGANNSTKTGSLFPVFDDQGNQLPMEENCLKCHAGHREAQYRDRMHTAGVTCYDCHGDMLAVGEAFPKNYPQHPEKLGSTERDDYRVPWFDQPDCGSCHTGNGNTGKDGKNGFFSAGVMKRAFDDKDNSATPRKINRNSGDSIRFTAAPLENYKASIPTDFYSDLDKSNGEFLTTKVDTLVDSALFRMGKDRHGNVACAACHGAAHSVWPNADPSSNDNLTALQLQGHTGTIHECNVCHTADAFKKKGDLDGGQYSGDTRSGVLGGPHNMHPINDPYWWNKDGIGAKGGWHNDFAKMPGRNGEDQCAACHGDDHLGTRLSKTPVDRDLIDEKGKPVKVLAGTPIGCNLCHTVEKSCTASPAGRLCGSGANAQAGSR